MYGYQYLFKDYPLEKGGRADVIVYSRDQPHSTIKATYMELPNWIAFKFINNFKLHTVVTDLEGSFTEENNNVRR